MGSQNQSESLFEKPNTLNDWWPLEEVGTVMKRTLFTVPHVLLTAPSTAMSASDDQYKLIN